MGLGFGRDYTIVHTLSQTKNCSKSSVLPKFFNNPQQPCLIWNCAAVSADDVWAVGSQDTPGGVGRNRALIEHWDGRRWSAVAIPDPAGTESLAKLPSERSRARPRLPGL